MRIVVSASGSLGAFIGRLTALPAQAMRAFVQGLNEGGDLQRTRSRRRLREQTGVKRAGAITKRTGSLNAGPGRLVYVIRGEGKGMPILEFPVSAGARKPVTAKPWGVGHTFKRSFQTSGQGLLRARLGPSRFPIRALYGPSVAKEIVKDETADDFRANGARLVEGAVIKRLGRMLP